MRSAAAKIDDLDLDVVRRKLTMSPEDGGYGWPEEETGEAIRAYRGFLKKALAYRTQRDGDANTDAEPGPAPDPVTDIVWHTHILFTEKYHQDCAAIFGTYLHHRPRVGTDASGDHHPAAI